MSSRSTICDCCEFIVYFKEAKSIKNLFPHHSIIGVVFPSREFVATPYDLAS